MPFGDEESRAEALRVRRDNIRRAQEDPLGLAKERIARELGSLLTNLLDSALGRGDWRDLPLDQRQKALFRCLEYGVGRPVSVTSQPQGDAKPDEEPPTLTIE